MPLWDPLDLRDDKLTDEAKIAESQCLLLPTGYLFRGERNAGAPHCGELVRGEQLDALASQSCRSDPQRDEDK